MENNSTHHLVTAKDTPSFLDKSIDVMKQAYPQYLTHGIEAYENWLALHQVYPEFQYGLVESATQRMIAQGSCLPLAWEGSFEQLPDEGCDWALAQGLTDHSQGRQPTVLCTVSISVVPEHRGKHLGSFLIEQMKKTAQAYKLDTLLFAARPILKQLYPLTPLEHYITWQDEQGLPFEPWLRVNVRQGAHLIGICSKSTTIINTISNWEAMVKMRFPETGDYVIPEGLVPLKIDYANNRGTYIEPNVWMYYNLA